MGSLVFAAAVSVAIFIIVLVVMPKALSSRSASHKSALFNKLSNPSGTDTVRELPDLENDSANSANESSGLPFITSLYELMLKAGYAQKITSVSVIIIAAMLVAAFLMYNTKFGIFGAIIAVVAVYFLAKKFFAHKVRKRNEAFIDDFPDAIDMIVRSVRSGHPLNTSLRMIVDNMGGTISGEFRQVIDEVAYGRAMTEALQRMAQRIDEPDLHFFVVVLSVQQETGGNLAEVLSNLSNIIRKRRQLYKKISALTSEGRMTGWILGGLPVFVFLVLYVMQPEYLEPLFVTFAGQVILFAAISMVVLALWISRQIINIDV